MANKTSRSIRRHHRQRIIDRAKRYYQHNQTYFSQPYSGKQLDNYCAKWANNLATCSCFGCGNPRRHKFNNKEKLTLQEKRAKKDFNDQLNDID